MDNSSSSHWRELMAVLQAERNGRIENLEVWLASADRDGLGMGAARQPPKANGEEHGFPQSGRCGERPLWKSQRYGDRANAAVTHGVRR